MSEAFNEARDVETRSREILEPFIRQRAFNGQYVTTDKGRLARRLQATVGDVLMNDKRGKIVSLELKAEEENAHGNFFIETWSNRSRWTVGWFLKLEADVLLYHFLKEDELYVINFVRLRRWLLTSSESNSWRPPIGRFSERPQSKYQQRNDTWGRCVPIQQVVAETGAKLFRPAAEKAARGVDPWLAEYGEED